MKLQMEKNYFYVVHHAIMKVRVALTFFSNILINLILPDPYTEVP